MEKKKFSVPLVLLCLTIAIIIVMGIIIFRFYSDNKRVNEDLAKLQNQVSELEKENTNAYTENALENSNENMADNQTDAENEITLEQAKKVAEDYLSLDAALGCDCLLEELTSKKVLEYNPEEDNVISDEEVITKVKFSDYKSAMLNYVSEKEFERSFRSNRIEFRENEEGFLVKQQGGGGSVEHNIKEITKNDDGSYHVISEATLVDANDTKENREYDFTFILLNGKYVVDSCVEKEE